MQTNYTRNVNLLTVIGLVGIISIQLFWIYFSYKESINHKKEHLKLQIAESRDEICKSLKYETAKNSTIDSLMKRIISQASGNNEFGYKIIGSKIVIDKSNGIDHGEGVETNFSCTSETGKIKIIIYPNFKSFESLSGIVVWALISAIFLILFTLFFNYHAQKYKSIQILEKTRNDFIANMTHELKTPIATISVASEMLMKKGNPFLTEDKIERYTNIIHEENRRLKTLVDKVLQISIFEKGNQNFHFEVVDMNEIIDDVFEPMLNYAIDKGIHISNMSLAKKGKIKGDAIHLKNLITNLLENSIKYSPGGGNIEISTENKGNSLIIKVKDHGVGISDENKEKVFEKFYRVYNGDLHTVKGFGLGLYYVKKVVEAHFGIVKITDNKPKGVVFTIEFPSI